MAEQTLSGMTIIVDGKKFILPISIIKRSFKAEEKSITNEPGGTRIISTIEGITALLNMSEYLDLPLTDKPLDEQIVMLLEDKRRRVGVFVDALVGECKVECKTLPSFCGDSDYIAGCALLSNNEMCLLINHEGLFDGITPDSEEEEEIAAPIIEEAPPMVIDKSGMENKYLTFELFEENYAIQIEYVKEIITMSEITEVPKSPPFVEGIINRRGDIIPVISFRKMVYAQEAAEPPTNIVIVECDDIAIGILIDKIKETLTIPAESVAPLPQNKELSNYVTTSGRHDNNVYLILDLLNIYAALQ